MSRRIVIAGAGVVGLAQAALLAARAPARQAEIIVIDPAEAAPEAGPDIELRVSAIAPGSVALLEECDAWSRIDADRRCAYQRMRVWDAADDENSPRAIGFDAADFGVAELGYIVENRAIQRALAGALREQAVTLRYGVAIESLAQEIAGTRLALSNGESLHCDLLIAADGVRSPVRDMLAIDAREHDYEQVAVVSHLRPARQHEFTAWQRFLPEGPIALLPLADGRVSVVWSTTTEQARLALDADDDELGRLITVASGGVLGDLQVEGPRGSFPLLARHAETYVSTAVALVGDAAHAIHPMAGQGANLGLRDADALAASVSDALAEGEHPGSRRVLRRYERQRRGDNALMLNGLTALNRLFGSNNPVLGELRRSGMQLFNGLPPLRRLALTTATGRAPE